MATRFSDHMKILLEFFVVMTKVTYYWLLSMVMVFVPTRLIAKDVKGKTVLITGAGGGIGSLLAENFGALGCRLVLWDINGALNTKTKQIVQKKHPECDVTVYTVDLSKLEEIKDTANKVLKYVGDVDILVNNAGVVFGKSVLDSVEGQMVKTMEVNCFAHYWTCKAFLPAMLSRNSGHIVTVASSAGLMGVPRMADYCASKFAAVGFEESLRNELGTLGKDGVHTTVVCPYLINTGMFDGCKSKFPFIMDALDPKYVADEVTKAVLRNQEVLYLPRLIYVLFAIKAILPVKCQYLLHDFAGATTLMNTFAGSHVKSH